MAETTTKSQSKEPKTRTYITIKATSSSDAEKGISTVQSIPETEVETRKIVLSEKIFPFFKFGVSEKTFLVDYGITTILEAIIDHKGNLKTSTEKGSSGQKMTFIHGVLAPDPRLSYYHEIGFAEKKLLPMKVMNTGDTKTHKLGKDYKEEKTSIEDVLLDGEEPKTLQKKGINEFVAYQNAFLKIIDDTVFGATLGIPKTKHYLYTPTCEEIDYQSGECKQRFEDLPVLLKKKDVVSGFVQLEKAKTETQENTYSVIDLPVNCSVIIGNTPVVSCMNDNAIQVLANAYASKQYAIDDIAVELETIDEEAENKEDVKKEVIGFLEAGSIAQKDIEICEDGEILSEELIEENEDDLSVCASVRIAKLSTNILASEGITNELKNNLDKEQKKAIEDAEKQTTEYINEHADSEVEPYADALLKTLEENGVKIIQDLFKESRKNPALVIAELLNMGVADGMVATTMSRDQIAEEDFTPEQDIETIIEERKTSEVFNTPHRIKELVESGRKACEKEIVPLLKEYDFPVEDEKEFCEGLVETTKKYVELKANHEVKEAYEINKHKKHTKSVFKRWMEANKDKVVEKLGSNEHAVKINRVISSFMTIGPAPPTENSKRVAVKLKNHNPLLKYYGDTNTLTARIGRIEEIIRNSFKGQDEVLVGLVSDSIVRKDILEATAEANGEFVNYPIHPLDRDAEISPMSRMYVLLGSDEEMEQATEFIQNILYESGNNPVHSDHLLLQAVHNKKGEEREKALNKIASAIVNGVEKSTRNLINALNSKGMHCYPAIHYDPRSTEELAIISTDSGAEFPVESMLNTIYLDPSIYCEYEEGEDTYPNPKIIGAIISALPGITNKDANDVTKYLEEFENN